MDADRSCVVRSSEGALANVTVAWNDGACGMGDKLATEPAWSHDAAAMVGVSIAAAWRMIARTPPGARLFASRAET